MGKEKVKVIFTRIFPFVFLLFLSIILFKPYFIKGLVPIPGDILIGHYYPWKDEIWQGRIAGYPIKNFILYDGIRQTLPWRLLAIEQMKAGNLPLWNPYILSGMPLLGNLQTAALYPLNLLFFVLPNLDAWTLYLFLQPLLAGIFTYLFARSLKGSSVASLLSGTCYGFSLLMMNHLEFGIDGHTALWLPLALLAVNKIQESPKTRWSLLFCISIAMTLLGGYPPPAIYNLVIIFIYILFKIRPIFSNKIIFVILGGLLAIFLTAPQTFPALELARKVIRDKSEFGLQANDFFFPIENLIMIIAPDFFGHPSTGNFFSSFYHTDNQSIGIVGFLFAIFGLLTFFRKKETRFWSFVFLIPMMIMIKNPISKIFASIGISIFSVVTPARLSWVVIFALAILAGIGLDEAINLISKKNNKNFFNYIFPIIFVFEIVLILWVASPQFLDIKYLAVAQKNLVLPTFYLVISSLLLILMAKFPKQSVILATVIVSLSGIELLRQGMKYNPFIGKELVYPKVEQLDRIADGKIFRTIAADQEVLPANSNIPYHISMIDGYASIYDGRYGQMVKIASSDYPVKTIENYPRIVFQTETNSRIIDLLGVKYVFSIEDILTSKYKLIDQKGKTKLYQNLKVFPKAFLIQDYSVIKNDLDIANEMLISDLQKKVILEEEPTLVEKSGTNLIGQASIIKYEDNQIFIKTITNKPSILVLNDSYDSGWQATIDNNPVQILRADYDLRAVEIPAGSHEIKFYYMPKSFKTGIVMFFSSISLSAVALAVLFLRRQRNI